MRRLEKKPSPEPTWKNEPGEPAIKGPGDLLAMMVQSEKADAEPDLESHEEPEETRAAEGLPPRKAIISIDGKDVEERQIPARRKRRVA